MTKIKAVVFNHNQRQTAEQLFISLSSQFDSGLFDSGSRRDQISDLTTHRFDNLYWTGCWNKAWELFPDYDVIWGIGGDCELRSTPELCKDAIESAYSFGTWSPAIQGKCHDYMRPGAASAGSVFSVQYLEGMAFAISRALWEIAGPLDAENYIGHGQDLYCCFVSRCHDLKNILDARVELFHPPSDQYDLLTARNLMFASLKRKFGQDWSDVMDWWWGRRISFKSNAVSRIELKNGEKRFIRPFISG